MVLFSDKLTAQEEHSTTQQTTSEEASHHEEKGFNAGKFIIDHVTDKYEWHLWGSHEQPVSIPLPLILYSKNTGLSIFLSNKLEHGASYEGYTLNHEGKIERADNSSFYDFSITKAVAGVLLTSFLVLIIFIPVAQTYARRAGQAPKGFQSFIEPLIIFVRDDIAKPSIGEKKYRRFVPLLLTIFFFIWISNFIGLIPSFPGVMGNISVAFSLAFVVLIMTLFIGNKHYWQHILWMPGVPAWVKIFLLTPIEIIGVVQRPFILMIRIFANIAAGHIVIMSFVCLIFIFGSQSEIGGWSFSPISILFSVFMNTMELLVAFLQAFVFTLLTAIYIGSCVEEAHHHEEQHH
ncbi:MAG TPA: F0F1 ATP synthase subunit A [Bacteroidia bacterium]|nr:F0F1 ATP synthase subunit A [Bacteroidia bacterium]